MAASPPLTGARAASPPSPGLDPLQPKPGLPGRRACHTLSVDDDPAMRPGPDAGIGATLPAQQIVPARRARAGMVRDLIGRPAGRCADFLGGLEHLRPPVLVRQAGKAARGGTPGERRARLDRQLIQRQMFARDGQRGSQFRPPVRNRLVLARMDQIEAHPVEQPVAKRHGRPRLGGCMGAAERAERGIVKRLNAQRQPVDPGSAISCQAASLDRTGIGLKRDLDRIRDGPARRDPVNQVADQVGWHQAWRATAQKHRIDRSAGHRIGQSVDLGQEGRAPPGHVDRGGDVTVEIAIRAFRGAERPVQIDPEPGSRGPQRLRVTAQAVPPEARQRPAHDG
jgi:hypothetical protein